MDTKEIQYQQLIELACCGKNISYNALAALVGLDVSQPADREELIQNLDDIAYRENCEGRPLLTAVVVRSEIPYPGKGFFILARELGFNQFDDERSYYEYELKKVYAFWRQHIPAFQTRPYMYAKGYEVRVG